MKLIGLGLSIVLLALTVSFGTVEKADDEERTPSCNCFQSNGSGGRQIAGNCYPIDCEWRPIYTFQ